MLFTVLVKSFIDQILHYLVLNRAILDQSKKDITLFSKKDSANVFYLNLHLNKLIALKFIVANYLNIMHAETS